jgi:hypothetical protein
MQPPRVFAELEPSLMSPQDGGRVAPEVTTRRRDAALYHPIVVPEAALEKTEAGVAPLGEGWFVLNAREARWRHREGRGESLPFTGSTDFEAETYFPQLGVNLVVLGPGEPNAMYHWETEQEDFLVLYGEALLIVEGQNGSCGSGTSCTVLPRRDTSSSEPGPAPAPSWR